jgi:hypothetical protein
MAAREKKLETGVMSIEPPSNPHETHQNSNLRADTVVPTMDKHKIVEAHVQPPILPKLLSMLFAKA